MKPSTIVATLVSSLFIGHDSLVAVAQTDNQTDKQKSVDPCDIELPEFMQAIRFQEMQERKEIEEGIRRQLRFKATSEDIVSLQGVRNSLKYLEMTGRKLSEAELRIVAELPNLEMLNLSECDIDDQDLLILRPCLRNLKTLWLTNKTIAALVPLASLRMLQIGGTSVNEDCLDDLIRMPNLYFFHTGGLNFSPEAERRLKAEALKSNKNDSVTKPYDGPRFTDYNLDCIDGWSFKKLKEKQTAWNAVLGITGRVELPDDAYDIHAAQGSFSPDHKNYLVFSTTLEGATAFAEKMSGKKLADFLSRKDGDIGRMSGEKAHIARGFPWKADSATESIFSKMPASNGGIVIDMKNFIVYLKR